MNEFKKTVSILFLLIFLFVLPALACGSETPTKVGEVEQESGSVPVATEVEAEAGGVTSATEQPVDEPTDISQPKPTQPSADTTFAIGDIIDFGDISMVVLGWNTPSGDDFNKPEEGNEFVVVDLLFVNTGSTSDSLSTMLQMQLKDSTSQVYNTDIGAAVASGSGSPDGEISPGERVRGSVGFQTPQDATGLQFVFDGSILGAGRVFVNLGDEPVSVEAPAEIAGETAMTTFEAGDIIEIGDLVLVVNGVTFPTGDDFTQPDDGKKFVVVDLSITNNTDSAQAVSSLLQMELKDTTGQSYEIDIMASVAAGGATPDGELAPGETIRGQVGYQVPVDAQGLIFVFDGDVFGSGKVFVNIPSE